MKGKGKVLMFAAGTAGVVPRLCQSWARQQSWRASLLLAVQEGALYA